jgi:hypothetical protein
MEGFAVVAFAFAGSTDGMPHVSRINAMPGETAGPNVTFVATTCRQLLSLTGRLPAYASSGLPTP